ncbi:hypothetical protein RhiirA1_485813 [Rhizophagus irregularis]|uniref:Uncharacterized protein n=1 Tax=Rhizophagus irregularis TaxID=588596 RepID=A0A2N0QHT2_9GLOM|nr:hypothetical protein RhiirA1_485813 [Rhizophagus irregularis]
MLMIKSSTSSTSPLLLSFHSLLLCNVESIAKRDFIIAFLKLGKLRISVMFESIAKRDEFLNLGKITKCFCDKQVQ